MSEKKAVLIRLVDDGRETVGTMLVYEGTVKLTQLCTLEPAWQANRQGVSCIPAGRYSVEPRTSDKYGAHYHIMDVEGRSWILIHKGNYRADTTGCILVGYSYADINQDGLLDVTSSGKALEFLLKIMGDERFTLTVVDATKC